MHYGYRIVEDMLDGLQNWMREKRLCQHRGLPRAKRAQDHRLESSELEFQIVARIHQEKCIGCELCYIACWDGAHQCIHLDRSHDLNGSHATPPMIEAASRARISMTPIPKLDRGVEAAARSRACRVWMRKSAWAVIYARWSVR